MLNNFQNQRDKITNNFEEKTAKLDRKKPQT